MYLLGDDEVVYNAPVGIVELRELKRCRVVCNHLPVPECQALFPCSCDRAAVITGAMLSKAVQPWRSTVATGDVNGSFWIRKVFSATAVHT